MRRLLPVLAGIFLALVISCAAESGRNSKTGTSQVSPEALTAEADARFQEFLASQEGDRKAATERTAAHLRTLPGVREVTVRGSDSLFVLFEDGNELLLMLGRNRL